MKATLEGVQALGFDSIEAYDKHQKWLENQHRITAEHREALAEAERNGSNIIDLRGVNWGDDHLWVSNARGDGMRRAKDTPKGMLVATRKVKRLARIGKPGVYSLSIAIHGVVELETFGTAEECDKIVEGY